MKTAFIFLLLLFAASCNGGNQDSGKLLFYNDKKEIIFKSHKIINVVIHRDGKTATIVLPAEDAAGIYKTTKNNPAIILYIDTLYLAKVNVIGPIDSHVIEVNLNDDTKLIQILKSEGIEYDLAGSP